MFVSKLACYTGFRHTGRVISVIIGTNRPGSTTAQVARHIADIYGALGVPVTLIDLEQLPPEIFLPAAYAQKPVSFEPFVQAVIQAAGLVVVSPEYNGGPPGVLKYFIDMLQYPEGLSGRPICFVGLSAGRWGGLRPVEQLQQVFGYRNAYIYPDRVFLSNSHALLDAAGQFCDPEIVRRLRTQAVGFIDFIERLRGIKLKSLMTPRSEPE